MQTVTERGGAGNVFYDFWMGRELNPRIGYPPTLPSYPTPYDTMNYDPMPYDPMPYALCFYDL